VGRRAERQVQLAIAASARFVVVSEDDWHH
jgi:hypothetical protein